MTTARTLWLFVLCFTFLYSPITAQTPSPSQKTEHKQRQIQALEAATHLSDLLVFDAVFPLSLENGQQIKRPNCALLHETGLFITNDTGTALYRYHLDGTFDRTIATTGKGPGSISHLVYATHVYGGQIGFWDNGPHQITVFSGSGEHQSVLRHRRFSFWGADWHTEGVAFKWPQRDTLILSNLRVAHQPEAYVGQATIHRPSNGGRVRLELTHVLGVRDLQHEQRFYPGRVFNLEQVGDSYWLGSPDFSMIQRINFGKDQHDVHPIQVPEPLTAKDYEKIEPTDGLRRLVVRDYRGTIHNMINLPQLVLVKVGKRGYVPFSPDGEQLLQRRLLPDVPGFRDVYHQTLMFLTEKKNLDQSAQRHGDPSVHYQSVAHLPDETPVVILAKLKPSFSGRPHRR